MQFKSWTKILKLWQWKLDSFKVDGAAVCCVWGLPYFKISLAVVQAADQARFAVLWAVAVAAPHRTRWSCCATCVRRLIRGTTASRRAVFTAVFPRGRGMIKVFAVVCTANQTMKALVIMVAITSTNVTGLILGAATASYSVGTNTIQSSRLHRICHFGAQRCERIL